MSNQKAIREEITAKIIAALEKDLLPWRRMWTPTGPGQHSNALTKKAYRGVNPLLLDLHAMEHGLTSKWWATYNQWHQLGCIIKRRPNYVQPGQWGATITAYIPVRKEVEDPDDDEEEEETYWILKKFVVFNAEQAEGLTAEKYQAVELPETTQPDFGPADDLILGTGADIHFGGDLAFYRRPTPEGTWPNHVNGDFIQVPHKSCFVNGAFYNTVLHELGHWSEVRLGWDHSKESYAMGELVAEISSCYLAAELGIPNGDSLENHASYLKSWLSGMKNDPSYIFKASKQASKVCDFLLNFVRPSETEPKPELVEAA